MNNKSLCIFLVFLVIHSHGLEISKSVEQIKDNVSQYEKIETMKKLFGSFPQGSLFNQLISVFKTSNLQKKASSESILSNNLEFDEGFPEIKDLTDIPDSITSYVGGKEHSWIIRLPGMALAEVICALLIFGMTLISLWKLIQHKTYHKIPYWFGWLFVALFLMVSCMEFAFSNFLLAIAGDKLMSWLSYNRIETPQIKSPILTFITSYLPVLNSTFTVANTRNPVFCSAAYIPNNSTFNSYPSGSVVHNYNLKLIRQLQTTDLPDLDYSRMQLETNPYPSSRGGITTRQARGFGGISNECEEFHGDINACCDDENNPTEEEKKDRCPGKILAEAAGHCSCIEQMSKLGFFVDELMVSSCLHDIRFSAQSLLLNLFLVDPVQPAK